MKTIFTLIILAFSVCSFGQKLTSADVDKAANEAAKKTNETYQLSTDGTVITATGIKNYRTPASPAKALTAADSIVLPIAKFEPSVKVDLDNFDAEITKLAKQYEDIIKAKNQTLKTAYGIYCGQKHIDPSRATVKLDKDGFIIQVLK